MNLSLFLKALQQMKKILLFIFIAFITSINSFANQILAAQVDTAITRHRSEKYMIEGFVYDSTGKVGIPEASVYLKGHQNKNCITNSVGQFKLLLPIKYRQKNFTIISACVGFEQEKLKVFNKKKFDNKNLIFMLRPRNDLDEVVQICCGN
jgi:hypothetical protein